MSSGWLGRREPTLERSSRSGDLRADPDDRIGGRRRSSGGGGRKQKGKRKARSRSLLGHLFYWSFVAGIWGFIGLTGLFAYHATQLPPIDQLAVPKRPPNIAIHAADGTLLANRGDTGGPAVSLKELPPYLPAAFVAIEDRRFYSHMGIDPIGIARAATRNLTGRGNVQGGSTLTQQLAKNLFLSQERTFSRKIQEAILALWLEHKFSKDQILELYLNRVYFGSGAYGVEAASRKYFGHGASKVTLQESAILAGLMKAPTKLAPNRNPEAAAERAQQVIAAMAQEGLITEAMAKLAQQKPAQAIHNGGAGSINYVADYVMDVLDDTVGAIDQDIVVSTTIDASMQDAAERALTEELDKQGRKFDVSQGAMVALSTTGQVKALVGGRSYADSQFNRAVAAKRQPGSAFKPFVYLTALERGLTPDTVREDSPINVRGWQPENSSRQYFGQVSLSRALALSLNTVAVRLGMEVGAKNVSATAHRLGITSDLQTNATIALGTSEVTPLELTSAYVPFANGGIHAQPHIITRVRTATGKLLYQRKGTGFGRIIEPQYVAMMNQMMQETLTIGTAKKAELKGWQAAGKTGTSQDYRDAWFVGYTSQIVAGVWLGNDDASPTRRTSGGNLPVDIWSRFMREAHKGIPPQGLPTGNWRDAEPPPSPPVAMATTNGAPIDLLPGSRGQNPALVPVAAPRPPASVGSSAPQPARPAGASTTPTRSAAQRDGGDLLPPATINGTGRPVEKNFLDRLFGG
jgi:penicillin-binding protein 1A